MGVIAVLLILVLGYHYTNSYLPEKILLKRSSGWEAYVHLGKYGLQFLLQGAVVLLIVWGLLFLVEGVFRQILSWFNVELDWLLSPLLWHEVPGIEGLKWFYIFALVAGFLIATSEAKSKSADTYPELEKISGLFAIVIRALSTQSLVKISLKSRKVYIGLIDSEQFESADLDYILIIPFQSGYRDKDTLTLKLDCDYLEVYQQHGINLIEGKNLSGLKKFRSSIRVAEIESISLFDSDYYEDFNPPSADVKPLGFLKGKRKA